MCSYNINPCRNNECVRYFTVFARNHRSYPKRNYSPKFLTASPARAI